MKPITTTTPHHDAFNPSHPSQNRRFPHKLFDDPAAQAVWVALLTVDVAVQHEFLAALRERLAVPTLSGGVETVRAARLVAAIREAEDILVAQASERDDFDATSPPQLTEDAYSRLRSLHRDHGWPAPSTLRNWANGSWNDVLRRAMLEPVEGGDAILMTTAAAYSWEEIAAALVAYRDELVERGHPTPQGFTQTNYLSWAHLPRVVALPGRRPLSNRPFTCLGGFLAAKAAALSNADSPASTTSRRAHRGSWVAPASKYSYDDEALLAAVEEVIDYLGGKVPRASEYSQVRGAILGDEEGRGLALRPFPSYTVLLQRYRPNWDAVLVGCGFKPLYDPDATVADDGQSVTRANRRRISDADLLAGVAEAFRFCGRPFTFSAYKAYIDERAHISRTGRPMAGDGVIYRRFNKHAHKRGVFNHVCDLALPAGWDADHTERLTAPFGNRHPISSEDLLNGLREAFEAVGKPFSARVYNNYMRTNGRVSKKGRPMSSYQSIYKRYSRYRKRRGAFNTACDRALPVGWDRPDRAAKLSEVRARKTS